MHEMIGAGISLVSFFASRSKARRAARRAWEAQMAMQRATLRQKQIAQAQLERDIPIKRGEAAAAASAKTGYTGSTSGPGQSLKQNFEAAAAEAQELASLGVLVEVKQLSALTAQQALEKRQMRLAPYLALGQFSGASLGLAKEQGLL